MALFAMTGSEKCYARGLTRSRFDRISRGGQSALLREKGRRTMDTSARTHVRRLELFGEYDLNEKGELGTLFGALPADGPATIDLSRVT